MKLLLWNAVLAFVAGFVTTLGTVMTQTGVPTDKAALWAAVGAAAWAGIRLAYGVFSKKFGPVPTLPVDG